MEILLALNNDIEYHIEYPTLIMFKAFDRCTLNVKGTQKKTAAYK